MRSNKKKVIAFHQSGLEKRTKCDFERSRTAATRSTTYKGSKNFKMLFFEENDVKNFDQNFDINSPILRVYVENETQLKLAREKRSRKTYW